MLGIVALLGLLWAYLPTLATLVRRWSHDPQYSHGFIVPVFALIVLWFRRGMFPPGTLRPSWWGVVLLLGGAGLRLVGVYYYYDFLDAVSLLPSVTGLCLLLGGWPILRWSWPAIAFLLFMLPLPYHVDLLLAYPLRRLATLASTYVLQTLGVPALAEGNVIVIEELRIGVVEACSGLGMLMTFFALSTAVAFVIGRPLFDKVFVFLSAVPVGVLMNVLRITVTAFLYRVASPELARAVFHDVAGWGMMPLALLVLWLELRFLDRLWIKPDPPCPVPLLQACVAPVGPAPSLISSVAESASEPRPREAERSFQEIPDAAP
jgi:exosortase